MSVYALDTQKADIPIYNNQAWLLDHTAKLERRLELGRYLSDEARAWLTRSKFPNRHTFWLECLVKADVDGVVCFRELASWQRFDTGRKQRYLVQGLIEHGLVVKLDDDRLRVTA